jgi:amidase
MTTSSISQLPSPLSRGAFLRHSGLAASALALGVHRLATPAARGAVSSDPADELVFMSTVKLAQLVREKKVSAVELLKAHFTRIDAVNPKLNAIVTFCRERAFAEADAADRALAAGRNLGPLHGVPMAIKDSWDTAGVISTGGTQGRAFFVPEKDATVVARLRAAGAILMGKTNTPEFTLGGVTGMGTTVNILHGMSRNPYDLTRSTAGSTGGGGAIIAAGGAPFDIGTDFGGSIRGPAHNNGIAGLKPQTGRVPRTGHIVDFGGVFDSYQQGGPMARRVEDLRLLMPILSGPDDLDALIAPMPWADPLAVDVSKLRVAYYLKFTPESPAPTKEMADVVLACAKHLESLGCKITESAPPDALLAAELSTKLREGDGNAWQLRLTKKYGTTVPGPNRRFDYPLIPTAEFTRLLEERDAWRSKMLQWVKNYDLILCPPALGPAQKIGDRATEGRSRGSSFTSTYNLTGWPSGVVRAGTSPEQLPLGIMATAQPWREDVVLAALGELERKFGGWKKPGNLAPAAIARA